MADATPPSGTVQTSPITEGASVRPLYTQRDMTMYAINENELSTISTMNIQATIYFTLASFLASSAIGVYTNAIFYSELTPAGQLAKYYAAPIILGISGLFFAIAITLVILRRRVWSNIRQTSRTVATTQ